MERGVASGAPRRSPRTAAGRAHRNGPDHGGPSPGSAPPSARRRRRGADARRGWGHRSYHRPRASGKRGHGRAPQPCRARRFARQEHRLAGGRVAGAGRFTRLPAPRLVGGGAELPVVFRFAQRSGELLADGVSTHRGAARRPRRSGPKSQSAPATEATHAGRRAGDRPDPPLGGRRVLPASCAGAARGHADAATRGCSPRVSKVRTTRGSRDTPPNSRTRTARAPTRTAAR